MDTLKTSLVLAAVTTAAGAFGFVGWGWAGSVAAALGAAAVSVLVWRSADALVLYLAGARPLGDGEAPMLEKIAAKVAHRVAVGEPHVRVLDSDQPNAFAVGRDSRRVTVVVTRGLMAGHRPYEIAAVVAHLLALVKAGRTPALTITVALALLVTAPAAAFALFGVRRNRAGGNRLAAWATAAVLAPLALLAALLVRPAARRGRIYAADARAAKLSGQPLRVASALRKIARGQKATPLAAAEAHPPLAALFVVDPLVWGGLNRLFATHPGVKARVRRLEKMAVERLNAGLNGHKKLAA